MAIVTVHRDHSPTVLVGCPSCGHSDVAQRSWLDRLLASSGHPHRCSHAVGDEISPLRNEICGCVDPVHARGA